MGNAPSASARPSNALSPPPSHHNHDTTKSSSKRDPRNLIQAQKAPAEASHAQARGTTTSSPRNRTSLSHSVAQAAQSSPSSSLHTPPQDDNIPQMGAQQSKPESKPTTSEQASKPVDVPASASNPPDNSTARSYNRSIELSGPASTQDMSYHLTRPPRLPLPIEEEVHTPGSPIIAPADITAPLLDLDSLDNETLPRRSSALSNTTIDEDDAEELQVDKSKATVPTTFEWRQGGDKVYVTGTIFQWNKKHRLLPVDGQPGLLRTVIHVRPGTHHIRFIVDGGLLCSTDLPTTVDFGNNLVNYIEVSADDIPQSTSTDPEDATSATASDSQSKDAASQPASDENAKAPKPAPRVKPVLSLESYTSQIPQYLLDLDKAEDSTEYQYAAASIEKLPTPPSLPGFLGKPILNAATPIRDDNSVLTMPNHTVLNHLATSSIKNNVLAVSATTRYKRKYVTTIVYKPTSDD